MDIALIIGVVLGLAFMVGSIAYALFVEGSPLNVNMILSGFLLGISQCFKPLKFSWADRVKNERRQTK